MTTEAFLRPRLTGARFDKGAIPLEFLKDLAVLQEMIIEVAKAEFIKANPQRQRSPRGFTEGIELRLVAIEGGCAVPVIELEIARKVPTLFPPESLEYLERAREAIVNAIWAAGQDELITDYLPETSLGYFDRIGRSLRDGEAMEFRSNGSARPSRLTKETRRKLLLASSRVTELTEEASVRGTVPEADQDNMTFQVQLADGHKVKAPLAPQHLEMIIEAFKQYRRGGRVLLQGIARFNRSNRLLEFDSIEHVNLLEALDISARLDELRSLKDGWLDGEGRAPSKDGLDWLAEALEQHLPEEIPSPFLYPTPEGGVQAEWSMGAREITLEIDLGKQSGMWHALDFESDAEESDEMDLTAESFWQMLVSRLKEMTEDGA